MQLHLGGGGEEDTRARWVETAWASCSSDLMVSSEMTSCFPAVSLTDNNKVQLDKSSVAMERRPRGDPGELAAR